MISVKEYPFLVAIVTRCCKLKERRMFWFCLLDSSGSSGRSIFVSPVRKITPFHFVLTSERNSSKPSNHAGLSDSVELF